LSSIPWLSSFFDEEFEMTVESNTVEKIWVITRNVPTLSEWGLIAMAGILGLVGFMVMRRRKALALCRYMMHDPGLKD